MDTLYDFIGYVAVFYVAFYLGKHWALFQFSHRIVENPQFMQEALRRIQELDQDVPQDAQALEIERVGDQLYAYRQDSKEFMAQGPDLSTLIAQIEQRFPNEKFFGKIAQTNQAKTLVN